MMCESVIYVKVIWTIMPLKRLISAKAPRTIIFYEKVIKILYISIFFRTFAPWMRAEGK